MLHVVSVPVLPFNLKIHVAASSITPRQEFPIFHISPSVQTFYILRCTDASEYTHKSLRSLHDYQRAPQSPCQNRSNRAGPLPSRASKTLPRRRMHDDPIRLQRLQVRGDASQEWSSRQPHPRWKSCHQPWYYHDQSIDGTDARVASLDGRLSAREQPTRADHSHRRPRDVPPRRRRCSLRLRANRRPMGFPPRPC